MMPLAVGGVHLWSAAVAAVLLVGSLGVTLATVSSSARVTRGLVLGTVAIGVAGGFSLLQLLPLPHGAVAVLSPALATLLDGEVTGCWPLSYEPGSTARGLIVLVALAAALWIGALVFARSRFLDLVGWLALAGLIVALLGVVQWLVGWRRPFDMFGPSRAVLVSSFVNPNHAGAFFGFTSYCAFARGAEVARRWFWRTLGCFLAMALAYTLSRGALIAYVGVACVLVREWVCRRRNLSFVVSTAVVGAGCFVLFSAEMLPRWVAEFRPLLQGDGLDKWTLWSGALPMIEDHLWTGVGLGALSGAYSPYQKYVRGHSVGFLENWPLDVAAAWGVPIGVVAVGLMGAAIWAGRRGFVWTPARRLATAGLAFLALQNLADFSWRTLGVGVGATAVLGALLAADACAGRQFSSMGCRASAVWVAAVWAVVGLLACFAWQHDLDRATTRARYLATQSPMETPWEARRQAFAHLLQTFPTDHVLPLLAAQAALEYSQPQAALHWVNRSLLLRPYFSSAHRLAARALTALGAQSQALLEYRLAYVNADGTLRNGLLGELFRLHGKTASLARFAGEDAQLLYDLGTAAWRRGRCDVAVALLDARTWNRSGALGAASACWSQLGKSDRAVEVARERVRRFPEEPEGAAALVQLLQGQQRDEEALAVLEAAVPRVTQGRFYLGLQLVELALRVGHTDLALSVLDELTVVAEDAAAQARVYVLRGRVLERRRAFGAALSAYRRADQLVPSDSKKRLLTNLRQRMARAREN